MAGQEKEKGVLFCFLKGRFSCLLLHSVRCIFTHVLGGESQLWAFFVSGTHSNAGRRMETSTRTWSKRKTRDYTQFSGTSLKETKQSSSVKHLKYCIYESVDSENCKFLIIYDKYVTCLFLFFSFFSTRGVLELFGWAIWQHSFLCCLFVRAATQRHFSGAPVYIFFLF